jgi:hypothetical protein
MRRSRDPRDQSVPPPGAGEINVHDSLDEQWAARIFLGKSLSEAEAIFRENALHYFEALLWMGPRAFCYYVVAAIRYLESESSAGDSDAVHALLGTLELRLEWGDAIEPAFPALRDAIGSILDHWEKFDVAPELYGDLPVRYRTVLQLLEA